MGRWADLMKWLGGGDVPRIAFDDDFFSWWEQQIIVVDYYHYADLDFLGDLDLALRLAATWGNISNKCFWFYDFMIFMIFQILKWTWKIFLIGFKWLIWWSCSRYWTSMTRWIPTSWMLWPKCRRGNCRYRATPTHNSTKLGEINSLSTNGGCRGSTYRYAASCGWHAMRLGLDS